MSFTFKQTDNKGVVMLEGDLTLPHAEALKDIFLKAIQESDDIIIAMEKVRNVDLSCLQLFCAANRSASHVKKHLAFQDNPPPALRQVAEAAGYDRLKGCRVDCCEGSCLWMAVSGENHER